MDTRNVADQYKGWEEDLIKKDLQSKSFPFSVCMLQLQGDFNMGTVVRNANVFGAEKVFYVGNKKWDRRGAVGTYHYTEVEWWDNWEDLADGIWTTHLVVALEDRAYAEAICDQSDRQKVYDLDEFNWAITPVEDSPFLMIFDKVLMLVGEEGAGIPEEILKRADYVVSIPQFGSVRSLNAGVASGIAMYDFVSKYKRNI